MTKKKKVPPSKGKTQKHIQVATQQTFSGPIPPPSILSEYNQIAPDAAIRILKMAEKQAAHRQEIEKKVIEADIYNSKAGLVCGLIIGLSAVIGGVLCIITGHDIGGSIIGGTGLTSLVSVFVYGTKERRKERENRFKQLTEKQAIQPDTTKKTRGG